MRRDTKQPIEVVHQDTLDQIRGLDPNTSHGWVIPRTDGRKLCPGPTMCRVCQLERALLRARRETTVIVEGFNIKPGDQILLIAPFGADRKGFEDLGRELRKRHPDVTFTIVAGFTGVQIAGS